MIWRILFWRCLLWSMFTRAEGFWDMTSIYNVLERFKRKTEIRAQCDEVQLLLQLAQLEITSPERIVMLVTNDPCFEMCPDIADVLKHIKASMNDCVPLPRENLYMRLYEAVKYFHEYYCVGKKKSKKHISHYNECLQHLHDDLVDCEGPADWFDKTDEECVCPEFNRIIDCNYVKAALLCGLKPAKILRTLSADVIKKVLLVKCSVSRKLPCLEDPMLDVGSRTKAFNYCIHISLLYCIFMLIFHYT